MTFNKEFAILKKPWETLIIEGYNGNNFSNKKNLIDNGIKVSVDLSDDNQICAYVAKKVSTHINFNKLKYYERKKFWQPLKPTNKTLTIKKNEFYILKSKEKIRGVI